MKKIALLMFMSTLFTVMPAHAEEKPTGVAAFKYALTVARDHAVTDAQKVIEAAEQLTDEEGQSYVDSLSVPDLGQYLGTVLDTFSEVGMELDVFVASGGGESWTVKGKELLKEIEAEAAAAKQTESEAAAEEESE